MQAIISILIERASILFCAASIFLIFLACTSYHPQPLDEESVSKEPETPDMAGLRAKASTIRHRILEPVDFDYRDGISPDAAAVLSVIGNYELRALRNIKGIAKAQLLQAGILPDPQLSYALDLPVGGSTAGTVNAFGLMFGWDVELLITRGAEIDAARAESDSVDLDVAWQEWQIAEAA